MPTYVLRHLPVFKHVVSLDKGKASKFLAAWEEPRVLALVLIIKNVYVGNIPLKSTHRLALHNQRQLLARILAKKTGVPRKQKLMVKNIPTVQIVLEAFLANE